jgi:exosome complex component RRP43
VFRAKQQGQGHGGKDDKNWVLADPDTFEETLCDEVVTMTVDCQNGKPTKILGISKSGGLAVGRLEMKALLEMAEKRWAEWNDLIKKKT